MAATAVLGACQLFLPSLDEREASFYLADNTQSRIRQQLPLQTALPLPETEKVHSDEMQNGLYLLDDALEAFVARAALIDQADSALDIRYYIWRADHSGRLLLQKLWQAAERGVRVRLLLDDNNTHKMDNLLAHLDHHPNIEIRLFNPFTNRNLRALAYLTDFSRLNRRMHNKSLTTDNYVSIVGGRNIGDEYFHFGGDTAFADLDILLQGKIVQEISEDFDLYWNSDSSYPAASIIGKSNRTQGEQQLFAHHTEKTSSYLKKIEQSPFNHLLHEKRVPFIKSEMQLISDNPDKALDRKVKVNILQSLNQTLQKPQNSIYLVSPYLVPTRYGMKAVDELQQKGVKMTVFTNSLRATDVAAVHSGYARYRKPLLLKGVELYEFKPEQAVPKGKDRGLTGSPVTSLHTKTFIVDRERLFVGSLNLDPRSAKLNTEMGIVIHHPSLAAQLEDTLRERTAQTAYQLSLDEKKRLQWQDPETGKNSRKEPEASFWKRWMSRFLSILPIERLL